jgi:hypothetical protein
MGERLVLHGAEVRVATVFAEGKIRPVWFELKRRRYQVEAVTYRWQGRRGEALLLHFAVSAAGGLFELVYDTTAQRWEVVCVEAA